MMRLASRIKRVEDMFRKQKEKSLVCISFVDFPSSRTVKEWIHQCSVQHGDLEQRRQAIELLQAQFNIPVGGGLVTTLHDGILVVDKDLRVVGRWDEERRQVISETR